MEIIVASYRENWLKPLCLTYIKEVIGSDLDGKMSSLAEFIYSYFSHSLQVPR
jgi:hypothetical protein